MSWQDHHKQEGMSFIIVRKEATQSPLHIRNALLVLDQVTGHVSPQFHVSLDPVFHTVKQYDYDTLWFLKYGFNNQMGKQIILVKTNY